MSPPGEPDNVARQLALHRLGELQIGILDTDIPAAQLVRRVLSNIGITHTHLTRTSDEMLVIVKSRKVDLLIVEWDSKPQSGLELTRILRGADSPNRMLPVILVTARALPEEHREAINAGVNDIVVKPFNVRQVMDAIMRIIDQPKSFIVARNYAGPDRRFGKKPPPVPNQRAPVEPKVIEKTAVNEIFLDETPRMILPDYSLKQKIESGGRRMAGLDQIMSVQNIKSTSDASKLSDDFVQWMLKDVETIRLNYKNLTTPGNSRYYIERISSAALSIRTRGLRSGYTFAARAATALHDFCQKRLDPKDPHHLLVVQKHIDTLQAILQSKLVGDENPTGRDLMSELQALVKKYI